MNGIRACGCVPIPPYWVIHAKPLTVALFCRISRASSGMRWAASRGGSCLDEEPQPATHGGLQKTSHTAE